MADLRIQYSEKMVGSNHPTLSDTLNRLALVEHNTDGTHKKLTQVTDPYIDVRAYGAVGDGSTDNATAITNAIAAASAVASGSSKGCVLYFPPGHFKFSTKQAITTPIRIIGAGSGVHQTIDVTGQTAETILEYTGTDAAFEVGDGTNVISGVQFEGFRLVLSTPTASTIGINFKNLSHTVQRQGRVYQAGQRRSWNFVNMARNRN